MTAEVHDKRSEIEAEGGVISGSPHAIRARAGGASVVQVELGLGKNAVVLLWLTCFISALAVVGLWANYSALRTVGAKYEVLQYDHQALKAQLVSAGVYEGTEH